MNSNDYVRKIILVGDGGVGKTSLIRRFVVDKYSDNYIQTIGAKVTKKDVNIPSEGGSVNMELMIWDLIGQEGFHRIQSTSIKNSAGALLVADMTKKETLGNLLSYWIPIIIRSAGPIPLVFLGNKGDLSENRQFDIADLQNVARNCEYFAPSPSFVTSAKTGENVESAFLELAHNIVEFRPGRGSTMAANELELNGANPLIDVIDKIFVDFAGQFGGIEYSTPFIKHQMKISGLDINQPTEDAIRRFIDNLAVIEKGQKPPEEVMANRKNRQRLFKSRLSSVKPILPDKNQNTLVF